MSAGATNAWSVIETGSLRDEAALVQALIAEAGLDAAARARARPALLALAATLFPFNTHLALYSTFWGGLVLLLAGLYAGALYGRDRPAQAR